MPRQMPCLTIPQSSFVAVSNLGSAILKYSPHRVLAGPYHRNIDGNIANLDILMGGSEESRQAMEKYGIRYIAHCPGNPETRKLVRAAPQSLLASLMRNEPPEWLKPVTASHEPGYTIYRVTDY